MIEFGEETCTDLNAACRREWLETNGIGGFASSTVIGLHARRYHGLLIAATKPPLGRLLLLSKLEETLILDGQRFELSANRFPGAIHPQGYRYLTRFRLDPFPVFSYDVDGLEIEKAIYMIHGCPSGGSRHHPASRQARRGAGLVVQRPVYDASPGLDRARRVVDVVACQQAATWLHAFDAHLHDAGLGQISEIFDGDAPHRPRGCMAQAWSVAELLRAIVEDVLEWQPSAAR